ncbi:MAG: type III-B CRISPR module-associated protein Cmr5 [Tepidanaerobacteraceae bacterium]|jgi:CRISPR-associated protein Cmr5
MKRNLEQKRAEYAFDTVKKRLKDFEGESKKRERYLTRAKSLPATIIMCGLGQTAATLLSVGKGKNDNPDQMLYEDLKNWICDNKEGGTYQEKDLIKAIVKNDRNKYIKAQAEALKLLEWLKKFATAYLSEEGGES